MHKHPKAVGCESPDALEPTRNIRPEIGAPEQVFRPVVDFYFQIGATRNQLVCHREIRSQRSSRIGGAKKIQQRDAEGFQNRDGVEAEGAVEVVQQPEFRSA